MNHAGTFHAHMIAEPKASGYYAGRTGIISLSFPDYFHSANHRVLLLDVLRKLVVVRPDVWARIRNA